MIAVFASIGLALGFRAFNRESTKLEVASPDGRFSVMVVERTRHFDRSFRVVFKSLRRGRETVVFRSWGQDPAIQFETVVWSPDSAKFALVGDAYFSTAEAQLANGLHLFLVHHLGTNQQWCNTSHAERKAQPITVDEATALLGVSLENRNYSVNSLSDNETHD